MPPPRSLLQRLLLFTLPVEALVLLLFGTWLVRGMEKRNLALADQRLKALQGDWLRRTSFDERGGLTGEMDPTVLPPDLRGCLLDGNGAVVWESPSGWFRDSGLRPSSREGLSVLATGYLDGAPARILRTGLRMRRPEDPALTATGPFVEAFLAQPLGPLLEADRRFRLQAVAVGGGVAVAHGRPSLDCGGVGARPGSTPRAATGWNPGAFGGGANPREWGPGGIEAHGSGRQRAPRPALGAVGNRTEADRGDGARPSHPGHPGQVHASDLAADGAW